MNLIGTMGNIGNILNMKRYISNRLNNLVYLFNQTRPCADEYIKFRYDLSVADVEEKIVQTCSVLDEEVFPQYCTASFKELRKYLTPGEKAVITVVCNDKSNTRMKRGGLTVTPIFSGVRVKDVTVVDKNDGSYEINFLVLDAGTLEFGVNVSGMLVSSCKLTKNLRWEIINASGSGSITNEGRTMNGAGAPFCYSLGDQSFESGILSWTVIVSGEKPDKQDDVTVHVGDRQHWRQ